MKKRKSPDYDAAAKRQAEKTERLLQELAKSKKLEKENKQKAKQVLKRRDDKRKILIGALAEAWARKGDPILNRIESEMYLWLDGDIPSGVFEADHDARRARIPKRALDNAQPADELVSVGDTGAE